MKKMALVLPLMATLALAVPEGPKPVTGKWSLSTDIAGNVSTLDCNFTQQEEALSGTCTSSEQGEVKIKGTVNGTKIAWSYDTTYEGSPLTVKYDGTVETDRIKGDATVDAFGVSGNFIATLAK